MAGGKRPYKPRKSDLSFVCYVLIDGQTIPVDELTDEQRQRWQQGMNQRLSENMSFYYSEPEHQEEYIALCNSLERKERT